MNMKKSLLIAVAAFFVALGANAQARKIEKAECIKSMSSQLKANQKFATKVQDFTPVKVAKKNGLRRIATADILGTYIFEYADFDRTFTESTTFTVESETGTITLDQYDGNPEFEYNVKISGLTDSRAVAYGSYDEESNQLLIPVQTLFTYKASDGTDYGRIVFSALVLDKDGEPLSYGYPLLLNIYEDGIVEVDAGDFSDDPEMPAGCYLGGYYNYMPDYLNPNTGGPYAWSYGADAELFIPNAVISDNEVHIESGAWGNWAWTEHPAYVEDYGEELVVHNFFGLCPISISVTGDKGSIATPVRVMESDYADEGEEPNYIQIWQWDENLKNIVNPGAITGTIYAGNGAKQIRFYDTEYKEAWTDESGEHEAGNYYIIDYTKWFMVHSTWGENGAYWWGEARYVDITWLTGETGINAISTTSQKSGKTYNVLGQQVSAGAKGLLIRDGKKFVVK